MKLRYILFAVLALLCLGACKKFLGLSPISGQVPSLVFSNVTTTQQAILGVYQELTGDQGYGKVVGMYFWTDNDETMGPTGDDQDRKGMAHYHLTAQNAQLESPFEQMYSGIERANQCIYYIPKMALYTQGTATQQAQLHRMYGEALTLRAQFFFELIRNWGDIPASYVPSFLATTLYLHKTDRDSIYDQLLADLQQAESLVPWRGDPIITSVDERLTKGAVKGLRARIALYRAGYSLRSNGQMVQGSNANVYYNICDTECLAIMNSGHHALNPSFRSIFHDYICAHTIDNTYGEIMFEVGMTGGTSSTDSKLGYYNGPRFASLGNSSFAILPSYFYLFDSTDLRRDVTIAPYDANADFTKVGQKSSAIRDGKFRRDWISPSPGTSSAQYFGLDYPILRYSDILLMYAEVENEINNGPTATGTAAYQQVRTRAYGGNTTLAGTPPTDYAGFKNALVNERSREFGAEGVRRFDLIRWNLLWTKLQLARNTLVAMGYGEAPYNNYPTSMYYYKGSTADNVALWANSFFVKQPSTAPANTTKVNWLGGGATGSIINTFLTTSGGFIGFAGYYDSVSFHTNLFPIPQHSLDANYNLTQNPGY
ncbi:RagB/SusD family nutrient uptake outer membrane protein [Dinghuibacter silviterrae]|uniref:Putative outer membrane starch-binding protein n=1 Tax=Dinghuibacter silviterrae TaxID=1539049 RepID=A0A4R8DH41_9BACT|nr:RagB/SusD family nutrient uptake outer membrane protein [Dinghuibacter silviterrae]TDW96426.1 putative outer membrane starch-binding protein [Dinghuibacter silviterrae]